VSAAGTVPALATCEYLLKQIDRVNGAKQITERSGCIEAAYAALRGFTNPNKGFAQQRLGLAKCGWSEPWERSEAERPH
jgi:hypothetical protein